MARLFVLFYILFAKKQHEHVKFLEQKSRTWKIYFTLLTFYVFDCTTNSYIAQVLWARHMLKFLCTILDPFYEYRRTALTAMSTSKSRAEESDSRTQAPLYNVG